MIEIVIINFQSFTAECCICEEMTDDNYSVAYYCEPTHDEIGSVTTRYTDGGIVGAAAACKACHDKHYGIEP